MTIENQGTSKKPFEGVAAELVVRHVRELIEGGDLKPGDRLPAERELALQVGVSRPSVRAGLRALAAMGVVQSRHGAGTFIRGGPPTLGSEPLSFLAALHGFTRDEMFEARRVLEVGVAGLAAERATGDQLASISEEITGMYASMDDPQAFLRHDIRFHRAVATAAANPILASLVEMVSEMFYEHRRKTVEQGSDLKEAADLHRSIYHALRNHDPDRARRHDGRASLTRSGQTGDGDRLRPRRRHRHLRRHLRRRRLNVLTGVDGRGDLFRAARNASADA